MPKHKKRKPNPNRIPCTQADVNRAKQSAQLKTLKLAFAICLYVLKDKFGFTFEQLSKAARWMDSTADSVVKGEIKWKEIADVLKEEYDITMCFTE